jgi:hypothetical protein
MKKARSLILFGVVLLLCFSKIQAQIYLEAIGGIKKLNNRYRWFRHVPTKVSPWIILEM